MHKFKLIKDSKVVGYEEHSLITYRYKPKEIGIFHSIHGNFSELEVYNILAYPGEFISHDEKCPFVCLDKNDKEVYAGDNTNFGIAIAAFESWVWTYTKDHSTYYWHQSTKQDIELITD